MVHHVVQLTASQAGRRGAVQIIGHRKNVAADIPPMLALIGSSGLERVAHHAADLLGEPGLHPKIHGYRGEDRHDHGRHQRDPREDAR